MNVSQMHAVRESLFLEQGDIPEVDFGYGKCEQFVPVTDKDGNLQVVGMKVPFEPIQAEFTSFTNDFLLKSGNVQPLSTYSTDVFGQLDKVSVVINSNNSKNVES